LTWTYSAVPACCPKDAVRFWIGDTDPDDPLVTDEEIVFALQSEGSNTKLAAAEILMALAAKFSRAVDTKLGDYSVSLSKKADAFAARAKQFKSEGQLSSALPYAGGISVSDKVMQMEDTDRVRPYFSKYMDDTPGVPQNGDLQVGGGCGYACGSCAYGC